MLNIKENLSTKFKIYKLKLLLKRLLLLLTELIYAKKSNFNVYFYNYHLCYCIVISNHFLKLINHILLINTLTSNIYISSPKILKINEIFQLDITIQNWIFHQKNHIFKWSCSKEIKMYIKARLKINLLKRLCIFRL